ALVEVPLAGHGLPEKGHTSAHRANCGLQTRKRSLQTATLPSSCRPAARGKRQPFWRACRSVPAALGPTPTSTVRNPRRRQSRRKSLLQRGPQAGVAADEVQRCGAARGAKPTTRSITSSWQAVGNKKRPFLNGWLCQFPIFISAGTLFTSPAWHRALLNRGA